MDASDPETHPTPSNVEEANDGNQSGHLKHYEQFKLPPNYKMNDLFLEIASQISKPVFDRMKVYFKDEFSGRQYSELKEVEEFFGSLYQQRYITPDNLIHLQKFVMMIDDRGIREGLMERIYKFAVSEKSIHFRECTENPANGFHRVKYHVKETKCLDMTSSDIKDLQLKVADLLGLTRDKILIDGIEKSNSLYVSFLIPEQHFELHQMLARIGLPTLSDFGVDIIYFGGNGFQVSSGEEIQEQHLVYRDRDEELAAVRKGRDILQEENLSLKKENADLKLKFDTLVDDTAEDTDVLSKKFDDSLQMAYDNDCDRVVISRLVSESLRLGKNIGMKHQNLKLAQLKEDLAYYTFLQKMTDQETAIKESVMKQLKILFETDGKYIDETEGYKPRLIKGAIKITKELSEKDFEKLQSDKSTKIPFDRLFMLHLFYEENRKSTNYIRLEKFMTDCLKVVNREDLVKTWRNCLKPSPDEDPLQKLLETIEESDEDSENKEGVDVGDLLRKTCAKLTEEEKKILKAKLPMGLEVKDDNDVLGLLLAARDIARPGTNDLGQLADFVKKTMGLVGRNDIIGYFLEEIERLKFDSGIKKEVKELLHKTSSKLTPDEKSRLKARLPKELQKMEHENDLLRYLLLERNKTKPEIKTFDQLRDFVGELLDSVERKDIVKYFFEETKSDSGIKEEVKELLQKTCSKLTPDEKLRLKARLPKELEMEHENDLLTYLLLERNKTKPEIETLDQLTDFVEELLDSVERKDMMKYFLETKSDSGIKTEVKELLQKTCSKLTRDEKLTLIARLPKELEVEHENALLTHLLLERNKTKPEIKSLNQLIDFVKETLAFVDRKDIEKYFLRQTKKLAQESFAQRFMPLLHQPEEKLRSSLEKGESKKSDTSSEWGSLQPEELKGLKDEIEKYNTSTKWGGLNPEELKEFIAGETAKIISSIAGETAKVLSVIAERKPSTTTYNIHAEDSFNKKYITNNISFKKVRTCHISTDQISGVQD